MNKYPTGTQITCRGFFALRELTEAEEDSYFAGLGLPSGVGYDPPSVVFIYEPNEGKPTTVSGASVIRDGTGAYHIVVTPEDTQAGMWRYRARGLNAEGKPIVTTEDRMFTATKTF